MSLLDWSEWLLLAATSLAVGTTAFSAWTIRHMLKQARPQLVYQAIKDKRCLRVCAEANGKTTHEPVPEGTEDICRCIMVLPLDPNKNPPA